MSSQIKELGTLKTKAKDKLLFEHDAHNIPPLGVRVGYLDINEKESSKEISERNKKVIYVGKIIDIIGPVKNPIIVVKTDKKTEKASYTESTTFFYLKEKKKKNFKKKAYKSKRNR
jgi:rRNA processing protein Gar1